MNNHSPANTRGILVAVAPNGARRSHSDHAALPLTPEELAETALSCSLAGAAMIHLHVRDDRGRHSLDPRRYELAIAAVKRRVGDNMLIQVSSEAAGQYSADQQMAAVEALMPECVSLGLREYIKDEPAIETVARFLEVLYRNSTLIQYILYGPGDIHWYEYLCEQGVIPGEKHMLLFVLGRYGEQAGHPSQLAEFLQALKRPSPWMACAFGANEASVMEEAIRQGGHCRIGFENNLEVRPGVTAADNAELVRSAAELVRKSGNGIADYRAAIQLFPKSCDSG